MSSRKSLQVTRPHRVPFHHGTLRARGWVFQAFILSVLVSLQAFGSTAPQGPSEVGRNLNAILSENKEHASKLEASLAPFLAELRKGEVSEKYLDPSQRSRNEFFFNGIEGYAGTSQSAEREARVMKSYSMDGETYRITLSITGTGDGDGAPYIYKIVELLAEPHGDGYRFGSPFDENTASFRRTKIEDVTFHYSASFDEQKAREFVQFRKELIANTKSEPGELDYFCFQSLDELLKSYGFLFDATKCNFLGGDLGFTDNGGARYVTGTARENYIFGYFGEHLRRHLPNESELYRPFVNGMATYYGGYALSGEGLEELKAQFRAKLAEVPGIDFLEEFKKGRRSSVKRHFTYYVISAFLCEEVMERGGFPAAHHLLYSGSDGGQFFARLKEHLDVDESNFHETILELIDA